MFISLPTHANGEIAFDFMESFIKVIQKESIKNAALWNDKKLKAYKQVTKT